MKLLIKPFCYQKHFLTNQEDKKEAKEEKIVGDFTPEEISAILARNQGLYNGFIAAGFIWRLFLAQVEPSWIWIFFLICVV